MTSMAQSDHRIVGYVPKLKVKEMTIVEVVAEKWAYGHGMSVRQCFFSSNR
jgi:hypothetical protein